MDKTAHENSDQISIYHIVVSINNTTITDKIFIQVRDTSKTQAEAFEKALILEQILQLVEVAHPGRLTQFMQISTGVHDSCGHESYDACVHEVFVRDSRSHSKAC